MKLKKGFITLAILSLFLLSLFSVLPIKAQEEPTVHYILSISVSPTEALWGQQLTINGVVNSSETLTVKVNFHEYYKDIHESVSTLSTNGVFATYHTPSAVGYFRVTAQVEGASSSSNVVEIVVRYSSPVSLISQPSTIATPIPKLSLVVLYKDGTYVENVLWENIVWANVDKVGIRRSDLGRAGFERDYGSILWYPIHPETHEEYDKPVLFVFERFWANVGGTWHKDYITKNIAKTPFLSKSSITKDGLNGEEWVLGWKGTITYGANSFPVSVAIKGSTFGNEWWLKTNVTTPINLQDHGIEYQMYLNPQLVGVVGKHIRYIRLFYKDGGQADYDIGLAMDKTVEIPNLVENIALLTESKIQINLFNFQDVFNIAQTKLLKIDQVTLPNGQTTYCLHVGATFGALNAGETMVIDPSTVGTSTIGTATQFPHQRKTFFANTRFWCFYSDGTNMTYQTSTDGSTWSGETDIRACTDGYMFSIWFDGTYLHYVYTSHTGATAIYYRRGTPNSDGTITWSDSEQTAVAGTGGVTLQNVHIGVDSGGYPWIGYLRYTGGTDDYPYITKSSMNNGTWSTQSGFPYNLEATDSTAWYVSSVPLTNQRLVAVFAYVGGVVRVKGWNGSAWNTTVTTTSGINLGYMHSAVNEGDDAHIVFAKTTYVLLHVKYTYSTNSLGSETTIQSATTDKTSPVLSINTANNDLYCFWATKTTGSPSGATANHVYYQKSTDGGANWGSMVDWIDETTDVLTGSDRLTCFNQVYSSKIGLIYMTKTASPYNVRFAFLTLNQAPTIGEFTAPSTVYAQKYAYLNFTVRDDDGIYAQLVNATLQINGTVTIKYDNATDTWSEYSDSNNYLTLDTAGCLETNLNSTAHKLSAKAKFHWNYTEGSIFVLTSETKVFDSQGASGTISSAVSYFTFEDDVIVTSASVDDSRVNPSDDLSFSGVLAYEGTTEPPASGNSALSFDGNDYIERLNFYDATDDFTITIYFKTSSSSLQYMFYRPYYRGYINNGQLNFGIHNGTSWDTLTASTSLADGNWHLATFRFVDSSNNMSIWADGSLSNSQILNGEIGDTTGYFRISNFPSGFIGTLDELRFLSRALSATEIDEYVQGIYQNNTGLVGYWPLDDHALDKSGNGYDGTIYGATYTQGKFFYLDTRVELSGVTKSTGYPMNVTDGVVKIPSFSAESLVGSHNYNVYAYTDQASVQNQTVSVIVDGLNASDQQIDLANSQVKVKILYAYDNSACSNANVSFLSSYQLTDSQGWATFDLAGVADFDYNQTAYPVQDSAYGITYVTQNQSIPIAKKQFLIQGESALTLSSLTWNPSTSELSMSAGDTGTRSIKVKAEKPYYIKIDQTTYSEGNKWVYTNGIIVITDTFSTKTIVISWASLPPPEPPAPPAGAPPAPAAELPSAEKIVETIIQPAIFAIPQYGVGIALLGLLFLGTGLAHKADEQELKTIFGFITLILALDLFFVWILVPTGLFPGDLQAIKPFLWEPPSLSLEYFGLVGTQQQTLQIALMGGLFAVFAIAIALVAGEE